jgi:uncharacterized protein YdeI (BOF family)
VTWFNNLHVDPLTLAVVSETNRSTFWFNDKRGPTIGIRAKGRGFESARLVPSTSVGVEGEIVDLVVNTSLGLMTWFNNLPWIC